MCIQKEKKITKDVVKRLKRDKMPYKTEKFE